MRKAVVFDLPDKKKDQAAAEMQMTHKDRLLLCLNLMEASIFLSKGKRLIQNSDDIQWIELKLKDGKSDS